MHLPRIDWIVAVMVALLVLPPSLTALRIAGVVPPETDKVISLTAIALVLVVIAGDIPL